ncbi:MAG: hypothetical protein HC882_05295 [Acidobacteria bacterium]|nr:hypothetical protein [Acidobacteriota bacterium]
MHRTKTVVTVLLALLALSVLPAFSQEPPPKPTPISAEAAFDAVMTQTDPITGASKKIALVDVRTRAEIFWIGAPAKVDDFTLVSGAKIVPDLGKVKLSIGGLFYEYRDAGRRRFIRTEDVASVKLTPIARNIPYQLWDETTGKTVPNGADFINFRTAVEKLANVEGVEVVIFFCRSGGRSEGCVAEFDPTLFEKLYEIDQPSTVDGNGGFEGNTYSNKYLGYRGFPGRITIFQATGAESVSWKDAGLPSRIGVSPF